MLDSTNQQVRLLHYDPAWRQEFQQTRSSILFACEGWVEAVEHVGSTAISGLIAQPVIDVVAGFAEPSSLSPAVRRMEGLHLRRCPLPDWAGSATEGDAAEESALLVKPRTGRPTHRVFLTRIGSPRWRRLLSIRDWLRNHPESAFDFEASKVERWKECQGDPAAYREAKRYLFAQLEERIEGS